MPPVDRTAIPGPIPARPSTVPSRAPARTDGSRAVRHFRLIDWRVLLGLFGLVDIPVIIVLLFLLFKPPILQTQASVCEQLDVTEFTPEKYERGLGGELAEDTLLSANTEYLIQTTLVVPKGRHLLVQPGAVLTFDQGAALEVRGGLYVCGTGKQPITFTSDKRTPGSWPGIRFYNANDESILSHALIQFAEDKAVYLENSAPMLLDVKIAKSSGFPISSDGSRLPELLGGVDLDENPFKGIEIRAGKLTKETVLWPNYGHVYVVPGPLEIDVNTTLVIEPDVVVKFWHAPRADPPGIGVRGLLKADGAKFTSIYDGREAMGGITYREAQDPAPGDWAGIGFYQSSVKSYLRHCIIQYAGNGQKGAVAMAASSPELTDVTIADTAWYPLSADTDSFPVLAEITMLDNEPGNALEIRGGSTVTGRQERAWELLGAEDQVVRVIRGEVTIDPEATLSIEPGVVIKFEENAKIVVKGTLHAVGGDQETERIVFTSLRDDDYGGKTDKATGPQDSRSWGGIVFEQVDESSVLENTIIRYASITLDDASPRLISNLIIESESAAIWASPGSVPEARDNELRDNGINGVAIWQAQIVADTSWSPLGTPEEQL